MRSLAQIYHDSPYRSKFVANARAEGYKKKEAEKYLNEHIIRDQKVPKPMYIPIVSKEPGGYQMDTFINAKQANGLNYLMLININTRKAYVYPMRGKGAAAVLTALNKFVKDEPNVSSIESDQDTAYLSDEVTTWMKNHNIKYTTTTDDNHNNLGIINRFMRTIRDLAANRNLIDPDIWDDISKDGTLSKTPTKTINNQQMQSLVQAYNNSKHTTIKKAPNDVTKEDEEQYIKEKKSMKNPYNYKEGDKVRIVEEKTIMGKRRRMVSNFQYTVDSKSGNLFKVASKDRSINEYPGYKLVKTKGYAPDAKTLKEGKRGNVVKINSYNPKTKEYMALWDDGKVYATIPKSLREGHPTMMSRIEREFWVKHPPIPDEFRKYI